ncbi:VWA domain-containing protein [Thiothrix subterranea]|uniref:vWA domain-containing protein n=1 Tax=Thiothrix subterranea TaxID=2735563 RepID=UPI00192BEBC1|nr:VWA domain-containing protein [Thiothrix subterranea]QQZ28205.1 VWA domain-containing protein [Thiothrix subterranea]
MNNDLILKYEELTDNPTARVPICLVLDVSGSMSGEPIRELENGVSMFFDAIKDDDIAQDSADISIVTFGSQVQVALDFASIHRQVIPNLIASGTTPLGEAVSMAISILEDRKSQYRKTGVDYYQPWLVIMTDGSPTDDISNASQRACTLESEKKLVIFPIGIGNSADLTQLSKFSGKRPALKLKGMNFKEFFQWLSQSVSRVSQSTVGDSVKLDTDGIKSWGEI